MLVAACVLPHPPLLIPEVSVAEPDWLAELRAAVRESVRELMAAVPDIVIAVGSGPHSGRWDEQAGGTLRPYGVDARAGGRDLVLPLSLTIAARLLDEAHWDGPRLFIALGPARAEHGDEPVDLGRALASHADRVALIAMGDGSAKRTTEAPGYLDERADAFDAAVVAALASGDTGALRALSRSLADELWVAGLPAWETLAEALDLGASVDALVRYDAAPRGVGYFVVDWVVRPPAV